MHLLLYNVIDSVMGVEFGNKDEKFYILIELVGWILYIRKKLRADNLKVDDQHSQIGHLV